MRSLALAALLLAALPAVAHAQAQVAVEYVPELNNRPTVVFVDGAGNAAQTYFLLRRDVENGPLYADFTHNAPVLPGNGCELSPGSSQSGTCVGFEFVLVDAGDGNDKVGLTLWRLNNQAQSEAFPGVALGGTGDDELSGNGPSAGQAGQQPLYAFDGGDGNDRLQSAAGDDYLDGGAGADTLIARDGSDEVHGGSGDDEVSAGFQGNGDVLDGGEGYDHISTVENYDYQRHLGVDVSVTEDGQPNDGEAGEGDNVTSVEQLDIHGRTVTFTGTAGADQVFVYSTTSTVAGLGGNDRLRGYDGSDTLEGGEGDDYLEGGFGNDVLDGGPGKDEFHGDTTERNVIATGNDQLRARDGIAELVDCGIGSDTAVVDPVDTVDASCESVDPPRGTGTGTGSGTGSAGGTSPAATLGFKLLGKLSLRALLRSGLRFALSCTGPCRVSGELRYKGRKVGKGSATLLQAGKARVTVRVSRQGRRVLKRLRRARLKLTVRVRDAAGVTTSFSRPLSLA